MPEKERYYEDIKQNLKQNGICDCDAENIAETLKKMREKQPDSSKPKFGRA